MTKKRATSGRISLYSKEDEFITSRIYKSINDRRRIISMWAKRYPHQTFYIIIRLEI
jgi:hypothetical protein